MESFGSFLGDTYYLTVSLKGTGNVVICLTNIYINS